MLIHSSMFRDLPARKNILIILFRSQRFFVDCVRGRQQARINRIIAVNNYPPSSTSTMNTFAIFARHIHHFSHPPVVSREDPFDNLHVNRAMRFWNQQH